MALLQYRPYQQFSPQQDACQITFAHLLGCWRTSALSMPMAARTSNTPTRRSVCSASTPKSCTRCARTSNLFQQTLLRLVEREPEQELFNGDFERNMRKRLHHDQSLIEKLVPNRKVGCQRIAPGEGYIEALQSPKLTSEVRTMQEITEHGIRITDGEEAKFDAIICATGFDDSFCLSWNLVGRNKRMLTTDWAHDPEA